jgi:hypothetical protein
VPDLQRFITEQLGGRIIYQAITAGKLWIMKGEEPPADMGR